MRIGLNSCKIALVSVIGFLLFTSCKNTDSGPCDLPPDNIVYFGIFDQDGNSLMGEENVYNPETLLLSQGSETISLYTSSPYNSDDIFMSFNYGLMEEGVDYDLRLNGDETDVFSFVFNFQETDCFTIKSIGEFLVNNVAVEEGENEVFRIIK